MTNKFRYIFIGFVLTFLSAWCGLVLLPIRGAGNFKQVPDPVTGEMIPPLMTALEERGRDVYIANGCVYCHSQQVSPKRSRSDIQRGWGSRRTIAHDYMNRGIAQLGTMRTGPDLANIGVRNPSPDWHLLHLYNPQITSPGSIMPPYRFLFEEKKTGSVGPSPKALKLSGDFALPEGIEIIPGDDVLALVAYLQSLKLSTYEVPGAAAARVESEIE
jgi:cytochrome c oxidase cbb3-type subunit 2